MSLNERFNKIKKTYEDYENWSGEVTGHHILCCHPANEDQLLDIVNWAKENNRKIRPVGMKHNWSPLTIANGENNSSVILVDLKGTVTKVLIEKMGEHALVTAKAGITMQDFVTQLETQKLGFVGMPAPGYLTLGGVLAIGGHGTSIPAKNEKTPPGGSYGSMSNSIISLKAVVWNSETESYELKLFQRKDPEISAFMVHVGRALIFEVTLQVPRNQRLRCISYVNITADELFAKESSGDKTFSYFLDQYGRAEAIWFPFTEKPWLKIWTIAPVYPSKSRPVHSPFNYGFSDNLPLKVSNLIKKINNGQPQLTPSLGQLQAELVNIGLGATNAFDLWGWSKDLLMYVKPSTLRVTANGYAILTKRENIQSVIYDFVSHYRKMVTDYKDRHSWPMNGPIEIRVTGLDKPDETLVAGAVTPALSAVKPDPAHPEWDVAVWLDILSMPGTPDACKFYNEMESWIYSHFSNKDCGVRVEWSKGWGYSDTAAWDNQERMQNTIPSSLSGGDNMSMDWNMAVSTLNEYDPYKLFSSPFVEKIFNMYS